MLRHNYVQIPRRLPATAFKLYTASTSPVPRRLRSTWASDRVTRILTWSIVPEVAARSSARLGSVEDKSAWSDGAGWSRMRQLLEDTFKQPCFGLGEAHG